jgi:peroxiredoxin
MTDSATIPASPVDVCPLLTGAPMPPVTLRTADGEAFHLNSAVIHQQSVVVFYRGGW